jgi:tetratricopeptide (TPR) repeat protein
MGRQNNEPYLLALTLLIGLISSDEAWAECGEVVGQFVDIHGEVETQADDGGDWASATLETSLCEGSSIRVGAQSRAAISLINDAVLRLDENTTMRLVNIIEEEEEQSLLDILRGAIQSFSRKPKKLMVNSPYLNGSIEGTEFVFRVTDEQTEITVFEGTVVAANEQGSVSVTGGEAASAGEGQAPQSRSVVRPRDAAQWSLYYPPVFATGGDQAANISSELRQAADDLAAGRVDQARPKLDRAIAADTDAGLAYALRAVINVVQNELEAALVDGNQAIASSPDSAAAHVALSYAQQASFQIDAARDTLLQAVEKQPEDALAWARLAELHLMLGDKQQASEAAQQAVEIAPDLGRTQITLGFAALAEFRAEDALAAFEKAITLDSADPLPHLGRGLARISNGELEQGRADIEAAVALGSNDALLRAYLGKAYFEEKRAPLDSEQFAIASELDPMDPTPWLYEGIAKQTQNRPVEATEALGKSIELNDNRATYRGRLLLDKDRAARGTSLARAYNDLGFSQLGVNESSRSLMLDPANASAHRFLSDTYRNVRRREVARVSELLQAQMMQDNNINPVQPSVSSTNLNIVTAGGPASAGFNEFTPLFERDKVQFNISGFRGENDNDDGETDGGEAVLSSVFDRYSVSAGAFDFDSDGFRENNHLSHEIQNIYGQMAITPELNIQTEFAHRDTEQGDLAQNFGEDDFDPTFERDFEEDIGRIGLRYSPNPRSDLLISAIWSERDQDTVGQIRQSVETGVPRIIGFQPSPPFPPGIPIFEFVDVTTDASQVTSTEEESEQFELQYLYKRSDLNLVTGVALAEVEQEYEIFNKLAFTPSDTLIGTGIDDPFAVKPEIEDTRAYVYGYFSAPARVNWTLGLSYHDYDEDDIDFDRYNPKLGAQWAVTDALSLRVAWFKVVKPALASNRTLEPTQVAGFNQYFDDTNATRSERLGLAADIKVSRNLFFGTEFSRRELKTPEFRTVSTTDWDVGYLDWDEWTHRAYIYWTPADRWSLSAEVAYDKFEGDEDTLINNTPLEVRTNSLPLRAQYFHPNGFFIGVGVTYVDQEVERSDVATYSEGDDDFTLTDISVGYRLPKRMGIASLSVQNVTDREFDYQDDSFREFQDEPSTGPYIPDRTVMGRVTINF